jgi:acyl-homoserine-lactone acylase
MRTLTKVTRKIVRFLSLLLFLSIVLIACKTVEAPQLQPRTATSSVPADNDLSSQVIIRRTEFGVPHVYAETMEAAGYALGYLQMEDHGAMVAEIFLKARGEWAKHNELTGSERDAAIDRDAASRRNYQRAVQTWNMLEQDTKDILSGFAKGMNRYIELNPAEFDEWVQPQYTGYDMHARGINSHSEATVLRFLDAQSVSTEESIWARLSNVEQEAHIEAGSNVWAFAPERTTNGKAILMRNPHLAWDAGYYEAQIQVPGVLNFYGDFRIGGPLGIVGGWNKNLGWSTTNNSPDLDEIYAFSIDPDRADHFLLDGTSMPVTTETIDVQYKHGSTLASESRTFLSTSYGPVIHQDGEQIYIIRSAGDGEFRGAEQFIKMMKASNLEEWINAMKMRARTSSNFTYADADGNIFYVWNASMPDRPHAMGDDMSAIHVVRSEQMWLDIVEWESLPMLLNPAGGYLRNENDSFHFTNLYEILPQENYPSYFDEPLFRLRSQHSHELVHNDTKFSLENVVAMKNSERMILADRVKDDLINAVMASNPEGDVFQAISMLQLWDNTVARDSRGGLLFEIWWNRYVSTAESARVEGSPASVGFAASPEKLFAKPWSLQEPTTTPYGLADHARAVDAFKWAVDRAESRHGHWNLMWGEVHRAVKGDVDVPVSGCSGMLGCFKVLWFSEHRDDASKREARGGDGWVFAVEFDEVPRAYSILAYGQSDKKQSPHFNDQLSVFADNQMKQVFFTEEEVIKNTIREYRPGYQLTSTKIGLE